MVKSGPLQRILANLAGGVQGQGLSYGPGGGAPRDLGYFSISGMQSHTFSLWERCDEGKEVYAQASCA